ncbi:hypothetical protein GVAV_001948 [Gurleya vavrai]
MRNSSEEKENDPTITYEIVDDFYMVGKHICKLIKKNKIKRLLHFLRLNDQENNKFVLQYFKDKRKKRAIDIAVEFLRHEIVYFLLIKYFKIEDIKSEKYFRYFDDNKDKIRSKFMKILTKTTQDLEILIRRHN